MGHRSGCSQRGAAHRSSRVPCLGRGTMHERARSKGQMLSHRSTTQQLKIGAIHYLQAERPPAPGFSLSVGRMRSPRRLPP